MNSHDQRRAYLIAAYLAIWAVALGFVLLTHWPASVAGKATGEPDRPNEPSTEQSQVKPDTGRATGDPNDPNAGLRQPQDVTGETTGNPNEPDEPAAKQPQLKGKLQTVFLVDDKDMNVGQVYQTSERVDTTFVLTPAQLPVPNRDFVILVAAMGALGACLHGMTSLAIHLGKKNFGAEWTLWYMYRPFVGGVLALIFHLIIAGGFMPQVNTGSGGFYGMIGLAGLIGLFSKQALNTLSKVFDVIFTADDAPPPPAQTATATPNPIPQLDSLDKSELPQGNTDAKVTLKGSRFVKGAVVRIGEEELKTTYKGENELIAVIPKDHLAQPGKLELIVVNPEPGGGQSQPQPLTVK